MMNSRLKLLASPLPKGRGRSRSAAQASGEGTLHTLALLDSPSPGSHLTMRSDLSPRGEVGCRLAYSFRSNPRPAGDTGGRMVRSTARAHLELPRRDRGGRHPLSGRQCRPDHAGHPALGNRFSLPAAGSPSVAGAMAAAQRLARRGRARALLLRIVLRALQHRGEFHDRRPRQPRAVDTAAADHGGRRPARHRAADQTENAGRRHRGRSASPPRWYPGCRPRRRAHGAAS